VQPSSIYRKQIWGCNLHPPNGRDLSTELDKVRTRVDNSAEDCATEVERLLPASWSTSACCPLRKFHNSRRQLRKSCQQSTSFSNVCRNHWPLALVCGAKLRGGHRAHEFRSSAPSLFYFPFFTSSLRTAVKYMLIYIYILVFLLRWWEKTCVVTPLSPVAPTTASWDARA
jgi:hypothetical protein